MLEKAEEQNNKYAQCTLGYCYEHGIGVRRDEEEAFAMYKKSADQNYSIAQTNLGVFYLNGKGVKKDIDQAIYWFQKAADQNNAQAKQALKEAFAERQMQQYAYAQSPTAHNQQPLQAPAPQPVVNKPSSPVDMNIPTTDKENSNTFAIVIGNEKYKNVAEVPFAVNDAKVFGEYLEKTLGVPHEQIKLIENAGFNDIRIAVNWLSQAMAVCEGKGKAIVYYAGHGIPNESDNSSYLLPVDGIGSDPASAYSLKDFYDKLGNMQAQSVTVFLDACFSGTKRDNGMLVAARGVAIKVKPSAPKGKMVVFSAAQGDETAYPYRDMQHGLFTYFLLKKLQETKGNVTLGELGDYLKSEVKRQSFLKNNKVQTPMISVATALQNQWKTTKL